MGYSEAVLRICIVVDTGKHLGLGLIGFDSWQGIHQSDLTHLNWYHTCFGHWYRLIIYD